MVALLSIVAGLALLPRYVCGFNVLKDYSGSTFFDGWDFYGYWDNLTLGDVWWQDEQTAMSQNLAFVNSAGNAIIRVDNFTDVTDTGKRNSVRITTHDSYTYGTIWMIDLVHIPFGCSVWPAFWAKGPVWPNDGEIDIIEAINSMETNQMALHTTSGCIHNTPSDQLGNSAQGQGADDCSTASGCVVVESKNNSFGSDFAANGGGVWATQFDTTGIFMWYWPRAQIPPSVLNSSPTASMDISDWGSPSASYPTNGCNITEFFTDQQLVIDITLCGVWAGVQSIYTATCTTPGATGMCYQDNVVGNGSNYDDAYFEINYVRVYTDQAVVTSSSSALPSGTQAADSNSTATSGSSSGTGAALRGTELSPLLLLCFIASLLMAPLF